MGRVHLAASAVALAAAEAACGAVAPSASSLAAAAPPALATTPVMVPAGERLVYRVSLGPFDGGEVVLVASSAPRPAGRIAVVRARIATSGLASLVDDRSLDERTWIDLARGRPLRFSSTMVGGGSGSPSAIEAVFDQDRATIDLVERSPSEVVRARQRVPGGAALNIYSALYALRGWSQQPAGPATLDVLARSRLWRMTVRQGGSTVISSARGGARVVRVDGVAWRTRPDGSPDGGTEARSFRLFFSDDGARLPLRLELDARLGVVRAELVDHR